MKKFSDFTMGDRIISVVSVAWLIVLFGISIEMTYYFKDFLVQFSVFGLLPVVVVVGLKWIMGARRKDI